MAVARASAGNFNRLGQQRPATCDARSAAGHRCRQVRQRETSARHRYGVLQLQFRPRKA
ncbi:hypothetical protein PF003_g24774 [Phytophthora fragariae]|nr:hypothetical protein PF003_g24774 [Phytophthora fragariae]